MTDVTTIPDIAVLIPSVNGLSMLSECLKALEPQASGENVEVIVADRCGEELRVRVAERFAWVDVIAGRSDETIPALRDRAIRRCRAPLVAVIEDHCLVSDGWLAEVRSAGGRLAERGFVAVGGPIENGAVERIRDWAAFLCEYSHAMGPIPAGETSGVPGNNVAYTREALELLLPERSERWEFFLHAKLRRGGHRFLFNPSMVVYHKRPFGFLEYVHQRFLYSRSFAAMRGGEMSSPRRWLVGLMSLALPPVLMVRISRQVLAKNRHIGKWVASVPLLSVFTVSWAVGEIVGYFFGAGRSLQKVN